jgi:hypothetical protein
MDLKTDLIKRRKALESEVIKGRALIKNTETQVARIEGAILLVGQLLKALEADADADATEPPAGPPDLQVVPRED